MTWEANNADIVCKILTTELCSKTNLVCFLEKLLLKVNITECTTCLVTCCWEVIVILDRSKLNCEEVLLSRCSTNDECDMIRRTSSSTEVLHLLNEEWEKCTLVLDCCLCHWVEVCLVGRATTLSYHHELILSTFYSFDVNLCWEVALSVHLIIHVERSILRVTEVVLCECIEHTTAESLFVLKSCPNLLSLLTMNDGSTCILAEWKNTLCCCVSITKEL